VKRTGLADGPCHVVVVPDGLAARNGQALAEPSFVYRAVLDAALASPPQDIIVLAPANAFGGPMTEEEAAEAAAGQAWLCRYQGKRAPLAPMA